MEDFFQLIINSPKENIESLVIARAMQLEDSISSDKERISPNERKFEYNSYYHGFIKKDVKIFSSMASGDLECFHLENYDYLIAFFNYIKDNNVDNKYKAMQLMSMFLDSYFGEYRGVDNRGKFILMNGGNISVDKFKNQGLAACSERAALTNNILEMLGLDSYYVTGSVDEEQHAFNIILNNNDNCYYLIDTTSCCGLFELNNNKIGSNIGSSTYIYNLGKRKAQLDEFLLQGKEKSLYNQIAVRAEDGRIGYFNNGEMKRYEVEPILLEEQQRSR